MTASQSAARRRVAVPILLVLLLGLVRRSVAAARPPAGPGRWLPAGLGIGVAVIVLTAAPGGQHHGVGAQTAPKYLAQLYACESRTQTGLVAGAGATPPSTDCARPTTRSFGTESFVTPTDPETGRVLVPRFSLRSNVSPAIFRNSYPDRVGITIEVAGYETSIVATNPGSGPPTDVYFLLYVPFDNTAPTILTDPDQTVAEDGTLPIDVESTDAEGDAHTRTFDPSVGTLDWTDGPLTYTPPADFSGTATFTLTATDVFGAASSRLITITVLPVNDPPVLVDGSVPSAVVAEATSADGAVVSYRPPTATDVDGTTPTVTCAPSSGSTFPIGTTTVTCTASDGTQSDTATFTVTVRDTAAPVVVPGTLVNVTVPATSTYGAVVSYALPTATDTVDPTVAVSCAPPPGGQFPIGTTVVTCTAMDDGGLTAAGTFTVTVDPNGFRDPRATRPGASPQTAPLPPASPRPERPTRPTR